MTVNIFDLFTKRIQKILQSIEGTKDVDVSRLVVEPPRDATHGDLATNAALVLAKPLKQNPRALAELLVEALLQDEDVASAEVAGPGFVNIRLHNAFWTRYLLTLLESGSDFGRNCVEEPRKVNVEYVSANPTGPMHVGHVRGAVVGDAVSSLMAFVGHDVTREYYLNDAGGQIDVLARSVFLRYREALGEDIGEIPGGMYPGEYLKPVGQTLAAANSDRLLSMSEEEWLPIIREHAIAEMVDLIKHDLSLLKIKHDVFFSEQSLHRKDGEASSPIESVLDDLRSRDFVYQGTLPPPKGKLPDDWEDREQTLLRASDYGDDSDRALVKSDGSYTYFAADVAYFVDKYKRDFDDILYVLGADHGGYAKRLGAVSSMIAGNKVDLSVLFCQLVKLIRNGEPAKMSKRAGDYVTLQDVVTEVGADAVRFMMLFRKSDASLEFDFDKVKEQSKDNPVFYVQYAHARAHSVFRQAEEAFGVDYNAAPLPDITLLESLNDLSELEMIRKMADFPRIVSTAAAVKEPHRLAFYLYELASLFHAHWNKGRNEPELRFVNPNSPDLSAARMALVKAMSLVLSIGLSIIGVSAPKEMR